LKSNGNVDCYGYNDWGQANDYTGGDAIGVAAGGYHTCVLKSNGNVDCYGYNDWGQANDYTGGDAKNPFRKYTSPEPTTSVGNEEIAVPNVTLDTASLISQGKMRSDCGDIRFTDSRSFDSALWTRNFSYNITNCNSANTQFLVNVSALSPTIGTTFFVYYGNPAVTSISQPISAFDYETTTLLPEETWIRISGGSSSLLITGGGGNLTIK
jgi:hypothetical protein